MLPLAAKIGLGCVGALCLARKKRRNAACPLPAPRRGQSCPAMPWLPEEVTAVMLECLQGGEESPTVMAVTALRAVYPVSADGQTLMWPTSPADCAEKRTLESRVILRAQRLIAEKRDLDAEELWFESGGY